MRELPTELVRLGELRPHPDNPNDGDVDDVADSLQRFGQWRPAVAQRSTGRVLIGNTMLRAAQKIGWDRLHVHWRDVDDDEARRILLRDNRSRDRASYDDKQLAELLAELEGSDAGLDGTGYAPDDLAGLLESLDLPDAPELTDGEEELGAGLPLPPLPPDTPPPTLSDRFIVPPFTVLDGRGGTWMERKRRWLSLGFRSEEGRGSNLLHTAHLDGEQYQGPKRRAALEESRSPSATVPARADGPHPGGGGGGAWIGRRPDGSTQAFDPKWSKGLTVGSLSGRIPSYYAQKAAAEAEVGRPLTAEEFERDHLRIGAAEGMSSSGTSVFDPVLCELAYRWFSPPAGHVLDPFAGGSVRGLMAALLGRSYEGRELRAEQVEANEQQRHIAPEGADIVWEPGDSRELPTDGRPADLLFTCPPYAWLERYSDDPNDLSTMDWPAFREAHREIIERAAMRLADNRFAVWVVGEVRSKGGDGHSVGLIADTIQAFQEAGLELYNELIYVTPVGSLPVRVGRFFTSSRKVGRTHQHVLVFVKGDAVEAARACGPVEVDLPEPAQQDATDDVLAELAPSMAGDRTPEQTPIERRDGVWIKRDDDYVFAGQAGGKVRSCRVLAAGANGLITASARSSPQQLIVASIAQRLGVPCRLHVPWAGKESDTLTRARALGAEVIEHRPGYNTVVVARAREDAEQHPGWRLVPFGMECEEAVEQTAGQVASLEAMPELPQRIVVPVGSGMSLAGILAGLAGSERLSAIPVIGVKVGADPVKRLDQWAPPGWRDAATLLDSGLPYETPAPDTAWAGLELDPWYEAKCLPFLRAGDLLWVVGTRYPDNASRPQPEQAGGGEEERAV